MLLPVQTTYRNVEHDAGLDDYVQKEADKLERFYDRISSCRVMVERPQRVQSGKLYHVRIDLELPNGELLVKHVPSLHGVLQDTKQEKSRREAESVLVHKTAKRAIHEAFQEMGRRLQDYARRQEGVIKAKRSTKEATVKEIFPEEGYGFLETSEGPVYFHQASVLNGHFARLRVGTRVRFDEEMGEKGPQATTVKIVLPRKQARSAAMTVPARSGRVRAKK